MKKKRTKHFIVLLIVCSVSMGLYLNKDVFESPSTAALLIKADGETLFRNIFFSEGDLADQIPEISSHSNDLSNLSSEKREQIAIIRETIVKKITEKHPEFYANFKKSIISGNHLLINAAIVQGINYSNETMTDIVKSNRFTHLIAQLEGIIIEGDGGLIYPGPGTYPGTYPGGQYWVGSNTSKMAIYSFPIASIKDNSLSADKLVNTIASTFKV